MKQSSRFNTIAMQYSFYANVSDKIELLNFIFSHTDLKVYDSYAAMSEQVVEYKTAHEIASKFDLEHGGEFAHTFDMWSPSHKGKVVFEKIELDPKYCEGHTFRYATRGFGLIQLHLGGIKNNELASSSIGHFNEKGAFRVEEQNLKYGRVSDWDWKAINKTSRLLKYQLHQKMSVRKFNSSSVLKGADALTQQGVKLFGEV